MCIKGDTMLHSNSRSFNIHYLHNDDHIIYTSLLTLSRHQKQLDAFEVIRFGYYTSKCKCL